MFVSLCYLHLTLCSDFSRPSVDCDPLTRFSVFKEIFYTFVFREYARLISIAFCVNVYLHFLCVCLFIAGDLLQMIRFVKTV